jgi:hypothetical protein
MSAAIIERTARMWRRIRGEREAAADDLRHWFVAARKSLPHDVGGDIGIGGVLSSQISLTSSGVMPKASFKGAEPQQIADALERTGRRAIVTPSQSGYAGGL